MVVNHLVSYLVEVLEYLKSFLQRAQPLFDLEAFLQQAESQALAAHSPMVEELKGDPLYCIACAKQFSSKGVYDGHLSGKLHSLTTSSLGILLQNVQERSTRKLLLLLSQEEEMLSA